MNNITINGVILSRNYDAPVRLNNGDLVIHYNKLGNVLGVYMVTSFRCTGTTKENTANHCSFVDMDNGYLKFEERCSRSTTMARVLSHLNRGDYYAKQAVKDGQYIEVHKCGEYKLDVQIDKQYLKEVENHGKNIHDEESA